MEQIKIFDTTLRDGEQAPGVCLDPLEKLAIARQLNKLGVDIIEAGFPISGEEDFEAVKLIAREVDGPVICALARLNKKDIDCAYEATKDSKHPRIHTFIGTSKSHRDQKLNKSRLEILDEIRKCVRYARSLCNDVEFSCEDASRTEVDFMIDSIKVAILAGATTINVPDTVGYSQPDEFFKMIKTVFNRLGDLIKKYDVCISVHCHNDLGLAVANSLAAVKAGATQVECTINGIGERTGNTSLEEFVMAIKTRKNHYNMGTGLNHSFLFETSRLVSKLSKMDISRNKPIVGENAFAHESGIHQHGILSDASTYEIMSPEEIGWEGKAIVIGKHSGGHAVESVLKLNDYPYKMDDLKKITTEVKKYAANKKRSLVDSEVIEIATKVGGGEQVVA